MYIPESKNENWVNPVMLTGRYVTLRQLTLSDCDDLIDAIKDGELWKIWYLLLPAPEDMLTTIKTYLLWQEQGKLIPFAVVDNKTGKPVGMTGYFKMFAYVKRLDIGWTWYRQSAQKTNINTETKFLLLKHAFEDLEANVIGFGANWFNQKSRTAIKRLGAKLDGTLRNHVKMPNGKICDYCLYSIVAREWPAVKSNLELKLLNPL